MATTTATVNMASTMDMANAMATDTVTDRKKVLNRNPVLRINLRINDSPFQSD